MLEKVNIRSVTLFAEPTVDLDLVKAFFGDARTMFPRPVQTVRLATTPFPLWWRLSHFLTIQLEETIQPWLEAGADFVSLGPVCLRHDAGWINKISELVACNDSVFVSAEIADCQGVVDIGRCSAIAEVTRRLATVKGDGSANLQFSALANCQAGTPYFPTAYHRGGPAQFAVAIEAAGLIFEAIMGAESLIDARLAIVNAIEQEAKLISEAAGKLAVSRELIFGGIDFSLAPFPRLESSLAGAMEKLGLTHFGVPGTMFAAAFLADAVGRASFPRCGFSGLFFPVLEDSVLAVRAGDGLVSVNDLLGYSAVCGAGLDTIPLAGDTSVDALAGILLDIGALASRLNKPLTARLMPLPGLAAGDPVNIDFPWFAPSRAMAVPDSGVKEHLAEPTRIELRAFHSSE